MKKTDELIILYKTKEVLSSCINELERSYNLDLLPKNQAILFELRMQHSIAVIRYSQHEKEYNQ